MSVTVRINERGLVPTGAGNPSVATAPSVCKTPSQPPLSIPIAYPSTAPPLDPSVKSLDSSKALNKSSLSVGTVDGPGTMLGAIKRDELKQGLQVAGFSVAGATVIAEGGPVVTSADQMLLYSISVAATGCPELAPTDPDGFFSCVIA